MKLHFSPASPYVRKVMACAILRRIDHLIETVPTNPHASPPDLLAANPLSKVPCLVTAEGVALFDSPVICEYLDSLGEAPSLFPAGFEARITALRQQAMADGVLDAAVGRRGMAALPQDEGRRAYDLRQRAAVARTLEVLEREANQLPGGFTIGSVAVGCALGYLDFRFGAEPWWEGHPRLAAWFEAASKEPPLARTVPVG